MKFLHTAIRATAPKVAGWALVAVALLGAGAAQAGDVYWSVGLSSPGVVVGVGNAPVYAHPAPVYVQPAPVYVQPRPVYLSSAPVYYGPPPVYLQPAPVYRAGWAAPGYARGWHQHFDRHHSRGKGHHWEHHGR